MNILLILTDQQSHDALGFLQPPGLLRTPAMDALAARGVVFTQAHCAQPLCGPSRSSLFTGRYPHQTGVMDNDDAHLPPIPFPCLGTTFRDAGYDTAYLGKWHVHLPLNDPAVSGFNFIANNRHNGADPYMLTPAREFLLRPRTRPFLLVASYNNPHNICEWARGERGDLPDGTIAEPPPADACPPLVPGHRPDPAEPPTLAALQSAYHASPSFPVGRFTPDDWRRYRWAYHRMIEHVDAHIGRLLATLEESGNAADTLVVFLSDHGDAQGAHGWNQKTILHDLSVRIPFILAHPRLAPGLSHALVNTGLDLYPTLLSAAGLPIPADLPGRDLWTLAQNHAAPPPRDHLVIETTFAQGAPQPELPARVSARLVRSDRHKYICYDHGPRRESLTDVLLDPHETTNLAATAAARPILDRHRAWLSEHLASTVDPFVFCPS